ncbi:MAG: sulfotransferase [Ketobacter sp.]|nr:sulfotransferase [Ketobacter sp.]
MNSTTFVIIGAPRSGTNMLRDVLTSLEGIETWPCDEINYIWRHGNIRHPSDEISADLATAKVRKYIRDHFDSIIKKTGAEAVVEKTCANSLRVPFVDQVVPEAKYLFIYRDGIDATGSARLRWTAKMDVAYILEKVRFVPKVDLPYYAFRYLWARLYRFFSKEKRLAFWGPALYNMQDILQKHSLDEVCALQWQRCVEQSEKAFSTMPDAKVLRIRYEDFVQSPKDELKRILDFMGRQVSEEILASAVSGVSSKSLGKGRQSLGEEKVRQLEELVGDTLKRYGYI